MGVRTWIYKKWGIKLRNFENSKPVDAIKSQTNWTRNPQNSTVKQGQPAQGELMGFIGRDTEQNIAEENISVSLLPTEQKRPYRVICFYTSDNEYAEIVKKLEASLDRFNIQHQLVPIKSVGPWELNCALKAKFVQQQWEQSDVPIVWIDADATVEESPEIFSFLDCDFAAHKWNGWELSSGTLYFAKTELAKKLIDQWVIRCEADPVNWDQVSLHSAWCDISSVLPLRTVWLPRSYYAIFDADGVERPVIKHWQASRRSRKEGRVIGKPQFDYTEQGLKNRSENILWRTPEEAFRILEGVHHIKPEIGKEYPEGFDVEEWLRAAIGSDYPLLEIGCGVGRIAKLFKPHEYIGVDINPTAIASAKASLPEHDLRLIDDGMEYPRSSAALLYTVLLHVSDKEVKRLLRNVSKSTDTIIIAELMDRRWRRDGNPPVFCRDAEDYILMMQRLGYALSYASKKPYARYDVEPWNIGKDSRITTLVFKSHKIYEILKRDLIVNPDPSPKALDSVVLNHAQFRVARHWFWPQFVEDWEETTWDFYKRFTKSGGTVIDIGAWVGPTLLFAALNGAKRLIAVEANPKTAAHLQRTKEANPEFFKELTIHNGAIHPFKGKISFGNIDGSQATSSASSTRGTGFKVDTFTIQEIIDRYHAQDACVIKIDIEGSEFEVADQIAQLAVLDAAILLSLHPPFWKKTNQLAAREFIGYLDGFDLYTAEGQVLNREKLIDMITYQESRFPSWGTPYGNFFEVMMLPKKTGLGSRASGGNQN